MRFLQYASIRQKLIAIILAVTLLSLFGGFSFEIYNNILTLKKDLVNNISLNAKLISDYAVPTILFDDPEEAESILEKLSNIPSVLHGDILMADGKVFAEYLKKSSSDTSEFHKPESLADENSRIIYVTEPVRSENEIIGKVNLVASTDIIREKTRDHIRVISLIFLLTSIFAVFLAFLLERIISQPILNLSKITKKIQDSGDFSVRVKKESYDETGILYDSYNDLLKSLEERKAERDHAEDALIKERESLEIRVKERTVELSAAKEKAEESDKLKSAFLANMSHEIRTPLNAILGFSTLIRSTSPTPVELEEYYKMMETSGNDLINLIDDILDISRIEANQIKINIKETSVRHIAEEVFCSFKQSLLSENPDNRVTPVFVFPPEKSDYVLNTDPLRLKQILLNILNNAIKFTPEGSIEFCYFPNDTKTHIIFYIKDTGIGIEKEQQKKIFERFTKVADVKTKHYRGTGLGLSIALKLTQLLNGEIRVESELNVGTAFYLTFPLYKELCPVATKENNQKDESLTFLSDKVILIVEDVEYNYRYLEVLLNRNLDVKLIWAKNGIEAVDYLKKNPDINIVLMDIQLPEMNGLDATKLIKSEHKSLPVIAQTAYGSPLDIEDCLNAGCSYVLVKPIHKSTLIQSLKKYII